MKQLFLSVLALLFSVAIFAQKASTDVAVFKTDVIDLGNVPQNVGAKAVFTVTNVGKTPLIIENAQPTCGCTIGDYTKSPIGLGKEGIVSATYDAKNIGYFSKTIKVKFAGFDDLRDLTIKGTVVENNNANSVAKEAKANTAAASITPMNAESKVKVESKANGAVQVKKKTTVNGQKHKSKTTYHKPVAKKG